ncbi:hypothetical protein ACIBW9_36425 [Streptomyces sp. NPDC049541]|uniref:hypothetical protein n=1 Tax=Streptomyces sp. NPDC049541 TaxID=3365594 RepID=UPI0037A6AD4B
MKIFGKSVAAVALTVGMSAAFALPAQAATASPMSTHRGTSGCFNWSWADGTTTATIYYHNTCNTTRDLCVWWRDGSVHRLHRLTAAADAKGHRKENGTIESQNIEDCT